MVQNGVRNGVTAPPANELFMGEPSRETKLAIIDEEIRAYVNTRYQLQLRHRVNRSLGNEKAVEAIEADLVNIEKALDLLSAARKELETV